MASVTAYILNQAEHNRKISYQEEIREIFKRHRSPSTNAMFGIEAPEGRTPFQGESLYITSPRAEAPGHFLAPKA